jgi:hypothetical protein
VGYIVEFFTVACKEYCARSWAIPNADDVALDVGGAVVGAGEGLVVTSLTGGGICKRVFMPALFIVRFHVSNALQ